jgi:peptidase E
MSVRQKVGAALGRPPRQIIALGGGGFTAQPENLALDRYILAQARARVPRVCFLPTATGDSDSYIARFYEAYAKLDCRPSSVKLFARTPDLRSILLEQDVIYVGGGNTKSMLAVWREWDLPAILREAWKSGIVLAGISAGAICWFDYGVTDSWATDLRPLACLGLLPGTCCPHYDGEADRRPALHRLVADGSLPEALALDDGVGAHFIGRKRHQLIRSRPAALAYTVRRERGLAIERPEAPLLLS